MALCPQCSDFLKPGTTACAECGWGQRDPARPSKPRETTAWSPPTPRLDTTPRDWTTLPPALPSDLQAALDAVKAKLAAGGELREVDREQERRYLAACAARKGTA